MTDDEYTTEGPGDVQDCSNKPVLYIIKCDGDGTAVLTSRFQEEFHLLSGKIPNFSYPANFVSPDHFGYLSRPGRPNVREPISGDISRVVRFIDANRRNAEIFGYNEHWLVELDGGRPDLLETLAETYDVRDHSSVEYL